MTRFYESAETKTHGLLLAEQGQLTETSIKLNQSVLNSTAASDSKTAALNDTEKAYIRGQATVQQVEKVRAEVDSANAKLTADQRLLSLAESALKEISQKISESARHVANARYQFCINERNRIAGELNNDVALQKRLLECFAAYCSNGISYNTDWKVFIASVLPTKPEQHLIDEAIEKFHQTHKLDRQ